MSACFVVLVQQGKKKLTSAKCFNRSNNAEYCEHQNNVPTFSKVTNHIISLNTKTEKNLFKITAYQILGIGRTQSRTHCFHCYFLAC